MQAQFPASLHCFKQKFSVTCMIYVNKLMGSSPKFFFTTSSSGRPLIDELVECSLFEMFLQTRKKQTPYILSSHNRTQWILGCIFRNFNELIVKYNNKVINTVSYYKNIKFFFTPKTCVLIYLYICGIRSYFKNILNPTYLSSRRCRACR